ncbi:DUF2075 domain-containing protein [Candidatus Gracilibacteria bacterium]|nr:DUF2075 domain-containing protein [Candidatus Gracilibacteria bacterium]
MNNNQEFSLPSLETISEVNMLKAIHFPIEKNLIVEGTPGTGKTVVALHRYFELKKQNKECLFLCFNRLLKEFIQKNSYYSKYDINTFDGFIYKYKKSEKFITSMDSEEIEKIFSNIIKERGNIEYNSIIIDEAQDLTLSILENLHILTKTLCFCLDERQTLGDASGKHQEYITIDAIYNTFPGITKINLTRNFRNSKEIYEWAANKFMKGNESATDPQLTKNAPHIEDSTSEFITGKNTIESQGEAICQILKELPNNKTCGILVPDTDTVKSISKYLTQQGIKHGSYISGKREQTDYFQNIFIANHFTCKGLEFDWVIVLVNKTTNTDYINERYYVLSTRAKERLRFISTF